MKILFNVLVLSLLVSLGTTTVDAQSRVRLSREQDRHNPEDYNIYANNPTGTDQHVVVVFMDLVGYTPSLGIPPAVNVEPGRSKIFEMKRDELTSEGTFQYQYYVYPGVANPDIKYVDYVLPVSAGNEVSVRKLTDARLSFGGSSAENVFYGLAFLGNEGDTIHAARGGVVQKIVQDQETEGENVVFSNVKNYMHIKHADGTIARYEVFKINSAQVKEGDEVLAGDPLALFTGENYQMGPNFRFSVRYLKFTYTKALRSNEWYSHHYLKPKFSTAKEGVKELQSNYTYTAVLNDELITQDMSRKQKKKYLKSKR
ncbi:peptidoglycan DD-metalloendopeptidase family protein [Roseivirga sp.]|uniref:peptidoglycan DD-metalloendopeptidase family protein n=1 Tax=Roseivirga sp. TaxID=1964215 RepID=UPI003B8B31EF